MNRQMAHAWLFASKLEYDQVILSGNRRTIVFTVASLAPYLEAKFSGGMLKLAKQTAVVCGCVKRGVTWREMSGHPERGWKD